MQPALNSIIRLFFQKESLAEVDGEDIRAMVEKYPSVNALHVINAIKSGRASDGKPTEEQVTGGLYVSNHLWLYKLLEQMDPPANAPEEKGQETIIENPEHIDVSQEMSEENLSVSNAVSAFSNSEPTVSAEAPGPDELAAAPETEIQAPQETSPEAGTEKEKETTDELPITFQSYHTIDYFASQGIRLRQEDLSKDKFGQQLKSFTDWLRSMKKLQANDEGRGLDNGMDDSRQKHVIQHAAHSVEGKEIVTEAMAEVWVKQGNHDKARVLYEKLSLQNPSKSAYFAAKIEQLK
ncbi:MAG TPA: hypothetical protein VK628_05320 [Flavitalea sp.]|nr:hypothetical protein [Flavitalea sp.]